MTRDRRLLLLVLLMAYGLFGVECNQRKDATTEVRHRHRHKHESSNRKSQHDLDRRSWQEVDYENDERDYEEDLTSEDDYEMPSYHDHLRSYQQQRSYHGRMFEPRYPARYYGGGYYGSGWYDKDSDRRKISSRYNVKNRRYTPSRSYYGRAYSRNYDASDYDDDMRGDFEYERSHRYVEDEAADKRPEWRRKARRHYSSPRRDWRSKMSRASYGRPDAWRNRLKDRTADRDKESKWTEYWRRITNSSEHRFHSSENESKSAEDEDYKDHGGLEENDKDDEEEEDDIWKISDKDEENDEMEELDNDFYKSKSKSVLTYDDIIRKLTSDDSTTARTTVKRDYRNIEERHAKREDYRHLKPQPRNISRVLGPFTFPSRPIINRPIINRSHAVNSSIKSAVSYEPKTPKNASTRRNDWQQERKTAVKTDETHSTHTKSKRDDLFDERYLYNPDNEKADLNTDEEDSDMQADVTDSGHADDDNEDEDSIDTSKIIDATTKTTTTSTIRTPTTTKSPLHQPGKNTRTYGRNTAAEYNGHQPKNDYPPMSAHSVHKWRTLGNRESVKQTMNNMRHSNNGEHSAAMQEATLYVNKIKEEAICKWPHAKLIRVGNLHSDPSISYFPHCVILHECSDNTGCCSTDQLTCAPSKTRVVELTIYARSINSSFHPVKLMFNNHTECECRNRTIEMQRINQSPSSLQKTTPCKCTKYFTPIHYHKGECRCECHDNNDRCKPLYRGKRSFDLDDRECITNKECTTPTCEFGSYKPWQYKCPTKRDSFEASLNNVMRESQYQTRRNDRRRRTG